MAPASGLCHHPGEQHQLTDFECDPVFEADATTDPPRPLVARNAAIVLGKRLDGAGSDVRF